MKLYFIPLIDLLCIFNVTCLQGTNNSMSFSKDASIMGKTCPDNKAFSAQNIQSMFVCATLCHQDEMCASFFFSSSAGMCDGCKLVYDDALWLTEEMEGSMYYKRSKSLCNNGWVTFNGKCFLFENRTELTWDEAVDYCSKEAAQLVTIRSQEVDTFLQKFVKQLFTGDSYKGMWIGCSDIKNEGSWRWNADQSLVGSGYSNWGPNEGNNAMRTTQNCGIMRGYNAFKWHDFPCHRKSYFICEK